MSTVAILLNCETGNMEAFASVEAIQKAYPDLYYNERNNQGDILVNRRPNGMGNIGYIQILRVRS